MRADVARQRRVVIDEDAAVVVLASQSHHCLRELLSLIALQRFVPDLDKSYPVGQSFVQTYQFRVNAVLAGVGDCVNRR